MTSPTMLILGSCGSSCEVYVRLKTMHPSIRVAFVDDKSDRREVRLGDTVLPVIKDWDFSKLRAGNDGDFRQFICGSGNPPVKQLLVERALAAGLEPGPTHVDPAAVMFAESVGRGGFIGPFCVVSPLVQIGDYVTLFTLVCVGHNSIVEDYATCAPGVVLPGSVHVKKGVFMGVGAVTHHNIEIAAGTVVGAQSCVLKQIDESNTIVAGVPAKKLD